MPRILPALVCTAVLLSGCGFIYKQDIQQGNILEQEQVDMLAPGMTRRQVALILGTPAINDPFHRERWDYVSSFKEGGDDVEVRRHLTLFFEGNELARIEGDLKPTGAEILGEKAVDEAVERVKKGETVERVGPQQQGPQQQRGPQPPPSEPPGR